MIPRILCTYSPGEEVTRQTWSIVNGNQLHVGQTIKSSSSEFSRDLCLTRSEVQSLLKMCVHFLNNENRTKFKSKK